MNKLIAIGCGSTLMGIGINGFILPQHILNGGFIGLALLLKYTAGFQVGLTIICLSAPIFLMALHYNKLYFFNSLMGMLLSSLLIEGMFPLQWLFHLPIWISACIGGAFIGTGVGLMMRYNTCVGGLDLLALLMSKWFRFNPGLLMIILDAIIITTGMILLKDPYLLFSFVTILIAGIVTALLTSYQSVNLFLS
ncbi:YitT family protein [Fictibacillus enclensis]|uniref:YitT family protein n=1 Tax=Fictibacillus enclensis TaxID=1017270 RepID=UPI0024BF3CA9|nr:YitT family protein [Fictibacillus enclensis]MDM5199199.1 YitT family protein [Fictibacillus enclensis]MDM5338383.1 YitT family protein [Fictibacillus enclensis]WHY74750.1 YitT family protein [Fictibacillus enclensis]